MKYLKVFETFERPSITKATRADYITAIELIYTL